MSESETDWWNKSQDEIQAEQPAKEKVLHPAGGPYIIRCADLFRATDGKDPKGNPYPRAMIVSLSEEKDNEGEPLWLFTTCGLLMGTTKKGKPRLRMVAEAYLGHIMGEDEARGLRPAALAELVIGRYAQGTVSHYGGGKGAQIDVFMPLKEGAAHPEIDLAGYARPSKFSGLSV